MKNQELAPTHGWRWLKWTIAPVVVIAVALAAFLYDPRNVFDRAEEVLAAERDTARVTVATLSETYSADGWLVPSGQQTATHPAEAPPGMLTAIVAEAITVQRGHELWRIDAEPTVVLFGDMPMYRDLQVGDVGPDVEQLEQNLVALGFDAEQTVTIDDTFTDNTALMVQRWQTDLGAAITGTVSVGSVVYAPGVVETGAVRVAVGDPVEPGTSMLELHRLQRHAEFTVAATDRDTLSVGDTVALQAAGGASVDAEVTTLRAQADGSLSASAVPGAPVSAAADLVPVSASWEVSLADAVLNVPAGALIRTDTGTYHLEVVRTDGASVLVPVEVGRHAGRRVEVIGDIADGDVVVSP